MKLAVNGRFLGTRVTGVQRVARQLVLALAERAAVTLYLPRGIDPPAGLHKQSTVARGVLRGVPWEQLELPARALRNGTELSLDPANAGPIMGGRRILLLHDVFPVSHPDWYTPGFRHWFSLAVAGAARSAARVIMFSEWAKREAVRALGLREEHVVVVTQGMSPFDGPPAAESVRATLARFGLRPGYILATGEGDARKNVRFLLDALPALQTAEPATLVLTGAPYPHVHAATGNKGETFPVRRLGFVSDQELRALYAGAGVFCFPSRAEGFGRPPLEAMACGAPVIAADYGSAGEVLGNAATILPLEPRAWLEAIRHILGDEGGRGPRSRAGQAHAAGFRWEVAAEQVLEVCRSALPDGPERTASHGQPRGWRR